MSTGFVVVASRGRCRASRRRVLVGSGSTRRPAASHASAQAIPGPPAFVTMPTRFPRGQRLAGEQRGDVEQLADGGGPDHAGVPEQRVDRRVRRREQRPRVRHRGARPGRRAPALDRDHRLAGGDAASDLPEPARVAERLQVQPDHVGAAASCSQYRSRSLPERSALFPVETNEDRPRPRRAASAIAAMPNAPLWDANATPPGGGATGANVAFSPTSGGRVEHAEAVRADQPHPARPAHVEQLGLAVAAARPDLREAGREDHERAHAGRAALPRDLNHGRGRDRDRPPARPDPGTSAIERCAGRPPTTSSRGCTTDRRPV